MVYRSCLFAFALVALLPIAAHALLGDTLEVATTWVDEQHPGMMSSQYDVIVADDGDATLGQLAFTRQLSPDLPPVPWRGVISIPPGGPNELAPLDPAIVRGSEASVVFSGGIYWPVFAHTSRTASSGPAATLSTLEPDGTVSGFPLPYSPVAHTMPFSHPRMATWGRLSEGIYMLTVARGVPDEHDPFVSPLVLMRHRVYDPASGLMINELPGPGYLILEDDAANPSHAIAVSSDGQLAVVAAAVSRIDPDGDVDSIHPANNDIMLWCSEDGGFSWSEPRNITQFIPPENDCLPDTLFACQDTFRVMTDIDLVVESDGTLHAAFVASGWRGFTPDGERPQSYQSRLFYWQGSIEDPDDFYFYEIADGWYDNNTADPARGESVICNPQLRVRPGDWVYERVAVCAWVQYGEAGLTTPEGEPLDASDEGIQATDIYMSAGYVTPYIVGWAEGVNITRTRTLATDLLPGETRSERELSMAPQWDDDFIDLMYTVDRDPGIALPADDPVGDPTENTIVLHRVALTELVDELGIPPMGWWGGSMDWARPNYPIHIDSTGYIEPFNNPVDEEVAATQPIRFELESIHPNPFNGTTTIAFTLPTPEVVRVTVHDILGREMATLLDRALPAGQHRIALDGSELASGIYLIRVDTRQRGARMGKAILLK